MYLPSLVSGTLIARFGAMRIMLVGVFCMLATLAVGLSGHAVMHYWWALVLLGVGWNFLFVGGTTQLVQTYRPAERFKSQAVNEFSVFGTSALASLLAGSLLVQVGWTSLLLTALPALGLMLLALLLLKLWPRSAAVPGQREQHVQHGQLSKPRQHGKRGDHARGHEGR